MASSKSEKGGAPEALRSLEAAARAGGVKPADQGLTAKSDTKALPDSNKRKAETATKVLRAGVANDPKAAGDAARAKPDPRLPK